MFRAFLYALSVLLILMGNVVTAGVIEDAPEFRIESMMLAAGQVSLQQAARVAKQHYGGKVVKADTQNRGGRLVHLIRLINNGRVKTVLIDAETGREISP